MTVAEATRLVKLRIRDTAQEEDLLQAKQLVGFVLGLEPAVLALHHGMELTDEQLKLLGGYAERRASGEPLQYIVGQWEFMGLPFDVDAQALIPRPDTEILVETALNATKTHGYRTALDLCCGSGCIGVALQKRGGLDVVSTDISSGCIRLTERNAALNGATLDVRQGDLFSTLNEGERFDLIVCNPPYLSDADMASLQPELKFEPRLALYGGADGLDFYRRIRAEYGDRLNGGGLLLLEIGATQADAIRELFGTADITKDYAGNPRVAAVTAGAQA